MNRITVNLLIEAIAVRLSRLSGSQGWCRTIELVFPAKIGHGVSGGWGCASVLTARRTISPRKLETELGVGDHLDGLQF